MRLKPSDGSTYHHKQSVAPQRAARSSLPLAGLGFGNQLIGNAWAVKTNNGPVHEPPLAFKVETKGTLNNVAKGALKEDIESEIARGLRFKTNTQFLNEVDLPVI